VQAVEQQAFIGLPDRTPGGRVRQDLQIVRGILGRMRQRQREGLRVRLAGRLGDGGRGVRYESASRRPPGRLP
jgi:hypothetical protein